MAVIVKYIVVRNGEEKMTFVTKKEADAYDKMLDIADHLFNFFGSSDIDIDEAQKEKISFLIAEQREEIMPILRGISPTKKQAKAKPPAKTSAKKAGLTKKASPVKTTAKSPVKNQAKNQVVPKAASAKKDE